MKFISITTIVWGISSIVLLNLMLVPINTCDYFSASYYWSAIPLLIRSLYLFFSFGSLLYFSHSLWTDNAESKEKLHLTEVTVLTFLKATLLIYILQKWGMNCFLPKEDQLPGSLYSIMNINLFNILTLCVIPGLFIKHPAGYIICLQLPLYFLTSLYKPASDSSYQCVPNVVYAIIFGGFWFILCNLKSMRNYWKITNKLRWGISFIIALAVSFISIWIGFSIR